MKLNPSHIHSVLDRIPPLWPLANFVAVNPFIGLLEHPFEDACAILERVSGKSPLQTPSEYFIAWQDGHITPEDINETGGDPEAMIEFLKSASPESPKSTLSTVAGFLDRDQLHPRWSNFVTSQISRWCGSIYDDNQTTWRSPWHGSDLFAGWKSATAHDLNPEAFGLRGFRAFVATLPDDPLDCIRACMEVVCPPGTDAVEFMHRQLLTISGWAGHVRYRVREDEMRGIKNPALAGLLAIRLAFDAALFHAFLAGTPAAGKWRNRTAPEVDTRRISMLTLWQNAYEAGYRRKLAGKLLTSHTLSSPARPSYQAIFCIDVRSEPLRRHLEQAAPDGRTIGFAGFFGFAVAHQTACGEPEGSRCPVLLVPTVKSLETGASGGRAEAGAWKAFQNSAASCFSFVEAAGLAFGATLAKRISGKSTSPRPAPRFADLSPEAAGDRLNTAEGALRNMGLTNQFARLVLFCGHGSRSMNNPHASSLDCGACGGNAGDVNARLAAATLNDPFIREGLAGRGIHIPADTFFLGGMHLTSTDEVTIFDRQLVPADHAEDLEKLTDALAKAGAGVRNERSHLLSGVDVRPDKMLASLQSRSGDIAQVRPEWALANNAALVAAPRHRTAGLNLEGRIFLQDYDVTHDPGDRILTAVLCAPVVVASWINLQYYASRLDPANLGAGDKTIHHVVGGIGVMEGNGGDLRVGLPLQSIHDGIRFIHEPRRLSVFIEAPRERIAAVLAANEPVRQLFDHGWIHLCAMDDNQCHLYQQGSWVTIAGNVPPGSFGSKPDLTEDSGALSALNPV